MPDPPEFVVSKRRAMFPPSTKRRNLSAKILRLRYGHWKFRSGQSKHLPEITAGKYGNYKALKLYKSGLAHYTVLPEWTPGVS